MIGRVREKVKDKLADKAANKIIERGTETIQTWRGKNVSDAKPSEKSETKVEVNAPRIQAAAVYVFEATQQTVKEVITQVSGAKEQKKEEVQEKIIQIQNAALTVRFASLPFFLIGALTLFTSETKLTDTVTLLTIGGALFVLGHEINTICENLLPILEKPLSYKEIPSGKWNVKKIGDQLKQDTFISGWVIDHIIIPYKFS